MKIAFITFEYPPLVVGGAGVYAKYMTEELARMGHEVHVLAPRFHVAPIERPTDANPHIHWTKSINKPYLAAISSMIETRRYIRYLERQVNGFDAIHENGQHAFQMLLEFLPKIKTGAPHGVGVHTLTSTSVDSEKPSPARRLTDRGELSYATEYAEKVVFKRADILVANSLFTRKQLISRYGIPESKVKVVYPGHPIEKISLTGEEKNEMRARLRLGDDPVLLFVGRLVKRKGLHFLLNALTLLKDDRRRFKLIVVGTGPEERTYMTLVHTLGLSEDIVFTGFVDTATLKRLYRLCDIVVVPSVNEPFGIVVLEAMAAKKPIVASRTGAIPEIVRDKTNGLLVDPRDSHQFAESLELFLQSEEMRRRIGEFNHRKVVEEFTWTRSAKALSRVYEMVSESRN